MSVPETYASALRYLYDLEASRGIDLKLDRVRAALASDGDPQRTFPVVHIAGTNGKGSTAAMVHAILHAAGWRVGLYTSPHLVEFTERIRVGDEPVAEETVAHLVAQVRTRLRRAGLELTFFEFVTVMALSHFAAVGVDVAVVEVGLGGRYDATNVVHSRVCGIVTVGRDHEQYLGTDVTAIAREKAGIIKPGVPVITGLLPPAAGAVVAAVARETGSPLYRSGEDFRLEEGTDGLRYRGIRRSWEGIRLGLRGTIQRGNAAVALALAEVLDADREIPETAVRTGLRHVTWPGRLDVVAERPRIILDGAHNPSAVSVLIDELPGLSGGRRVHLVFGAMQDKAWRVMAAQLAPLADTVTTTAVAQRRAEDPEVLAAEFGRWVPARAVPRSGDALARACAHAGPEGVVLVTGSLFLVGEVYAVISAAGGLNGVSAPRRSRAVSDGAAR